MVLLYPLHVAQGDGPGGRELSRSTLHASTGGKLRCGHSGQNAVQQRNEGEAFDTSFFVVPLLALLPPRVALIQLDGAVFMVARQGSNFS